MSRCCGCWRPHPPPNAPPAPARSPPYATCSTPWTPPALSWLEQHPQTTHLAHARAVAGLAVTITRGAADSSSRNDPDAGADAYRWGRISKKLQNLGELKAGDRDHLVGELAAANDWLHHQLRTHQQARSTGSDPAWREALSTRKGRLPAFATQIDGVVAAATTQGQLCVPQAELDMSAPRHGVFQAKPSWRQATATDHPIEALRRELHAAARVPADREQALGQALGDPAALARLAFTQPPTPGRGTGASQQSAPGPATTIAAARGRRGQHTVDHPCQDRVAALEERGMQWTVGYGTPGSVG